MTHNLRSSPVNYIALFLACPCFSTHSSPLTAHRPAWSTMAPSIAASRSSSVSSQAGLSASERTALLAAAPSSSTSAQTPPKTAPAHTPSHQRVIGGHDRKASISARSVSSRYGSILASPSPVDKIARFSPAGQRVRPLSKRRKTLTVVSYGCRLGFTDLHSTPPYLAPCCAQSSACCCSSTPLWIGLYQAWHIGECIVGGPDER